MAEQLYQLQTLERVCNPTSACTEREGSLGRSERCHPTNIKCAFHQSLKIAVSVIARSDHLITLIAEEIGKPLRKKSIQWFIDSETEAHQTHGNCLLEKPILNGDIGVVGTEEGEVVFVDLLSKQELMRVKIGDSVMNLEVVHHGRFLTYLLVSTVTNNQFGLLLEQTSSRTESLSNFLGSQATSYSSPWPPTCSVPLSLSLTKFSDITGKEHLSDAKLQTLSLPIGEEVVGIYRQRFPKHRGPTDEVADETVNDESTTRKVKTWKMVVSSLETGVYQIKPQVNFDNLCLNLIAEGQTKKAEILGMTLDLNMSSLFLRAAEHKLQQAQLQEATRLYCISRCSSMVWAYHLAKYGYFQETLSVIQGILNKQGEQGHSNCCKLAIVAIKCLIFVYLNSNDRREIQRMLATFLSDNLDYDEVEAIHVLASHSLWEFMFDMARTRGHLETAMDTLFDQWPTRADPTLLRKVTSPEFLDAFVSAKNGIFIERLSKLEVVSILMLRIDLVLRHSTFLTSHLHLLNVQQLILLASLLDPTKPKMRDIFETGRKRSPSTSSIGSVDSFYGSENMKTTEPSTLVQFFILTLIELHSRRIRKGYEVTQEPSLAEIDKTCIHRDATMRHQSGHSDIRRNLISCGRNHAGLVSSGELYTWGKATSGRPWFHHSCRGFSPPLRVETLHMHQQQVLSISCGNKHTLALTSTGRVYAWGSSKFGQIGVGDRKTRTHPSLVDELQGSGCVEIVCGQYHSLARTQDNQVWSWGWGVHGQLGHGSVEDQLIPQVVGSLVGKDIVQIGAGACHSGVLSADGKVWMFGSGTFGQLGLEVVRKTSHPLHLAVFNDQPVRMLACGYYHNLALTAPEPHQLYIWGKSPVEIKTQIQVTRKLKKAGRMPSQSAVLSERGHMTPMLVSTKHLSSPVKKMVCSYTHNILLTESGKIFTWGRNDMDQLGNPSTHKKYEDTPCMIQPSQNFADIAAGLEFSAAVNHYGVVYSWGSAESDQLGHGMQNQALLASTVVSIPSPRRIPNVPLITIPVQLLKSPFFSIDKYSIDQSSAPRGVIENLSQDISNLAIPVDNKPPYSEVSLYFVLEHLRGYYQLPVVLKECQDRQMWSLASKIYFMMEDFENGLSFALKALKDENPCLTLKDATAFLSSYFGDLSKKISLDRLYNHQRILQKILIKIFIFWEEKSFRPLDLEPTLSEHLGLLAYSLSILLFSSKASKTAIPSEKVLLLEKFQSSFSTKFCLDVTSAASTFIQTGKFTVLGDLKMSNALNDLSPEKEATADSVPLSSKDQLLPNLMRGNSHFGEEGLMIAPNSTTAEMVVFTCEHSYGRSEFNKEVEAIERKLLSYSDTLTVTCAIMKGIYEDESQLMPSACPQCTLASLLPLVQY
ncbi:hypothetical protein BSL78_11377 [Apostichopus japonicus]|uniref:RCC1-like domain-containing protein n=1 Tax=Stichopus japonicus TaxID=307972 RepID=A0A2G8KUQ2_STIJA|nr:hypothetical protein BSL78_11377 [Apostichopus japonicus]